MTQVALAKQVLSSGVEDAMEVGVRVMATVLDRILLQFEVCSQSPLILSIPCLTW
jgi:hypothetical protein